MGFTTRSSSMLRGWTCVFTLVLIWVMAYGPNAASEPQAELKVIRVGYSKKLFKGVSLKDIQVAVELWAKQLTAQLGRPVAPKVLFFDSQAELVQASAAGEVDVANMDVLEYLDVRDRGILEPRLVSVIGDQVFEEYILLVRRDRGLDGLDALRGRHLVSVTAGPRASSIPIIWLETVLLRKNLGLKETFFGRIQEVGKVSQAILAVFFGQADVCLVAKQMLKTMTELNPQVGEELSVVATSSPLLTGLVCFPHNGDPETQRFVLEGALQLHDHPRGRQILTLFGVNRMKLFRPTYLDSITALIEEYSDLEMRSEGEN